LPHKSESPYSLRLRGDFAFFAPLRELVTDHESHERTNHTNFSVLLPVFASSREMEYNLRRKFV